MLKSGLWTLSLAMIIFSTSLLGWAEKRNPQKLEEISIKYQKYKKDNFSTAPDLTAETLREMLVKNEVVLVDVRTAKEQAVSKLPGALTKADFEATKSNHKGKKIINYCTIGWRSGVFTVKINKEGFDSYNLIGGILSWTHVGGELIDNAGQLTKKVHVYGDEWDLAADDYISVK